MLFLPHSLGNKLYGNLLIYFPKIYQLALNSEEKLKYIDIVLCKH